MTKTGPTASADELIDANPELLDSRMMLTHYSAELLFSEEARRSWTRSRKPVSTSTRINNLDKPDNERF